MFYRFRQGKSNRATVPHGDGAFKFTSRCAFWPEKYEF